MYHHEAETRTTAAVITIPPSPKSSQVSSPSTSPRVGKSPRSPDGQTGDEVQKHGCNPELKSHLSFPSSVVPFPLASPRQERQFKEWMERMLKEMTTTITDSIKTGS